MKLLGFDFGRRRIGVALAIRGVASPLETIEFDSFSQAERRIAELCSLHRPEKMIWGFCRGKIGSQTVKFAKRVSGLVGLPVEFIDETLTSKDADIILVRNKKKKVKNDQLAAALILEYFLDEEGR